MCKKSGIFYSTSTAVIHDKEQPGRHDLIVTFAGSASSERDSSPLFATCPDSRPSSESRDWGFVFTVQPQISSIR